MPVWSGERGDDLGAIPWEGMLKGGPHDERYREVVLAVRVPR